MLPNILHRIDCHTRDDDQKRDPEELRSKIIAAAGSPIRVIKEITNSREIKRTLKVTIAPWGNLCLHEYIWDPKRIALSPFHFSRAERTWRFYNELISNQIPVPEFIFFLEVKKLIFAVKTYLATRWIEGSCSLHHLALKKDIPYSFDFQAILCMCVDTLIKLHKAGFIHGDLKWSNLRYILNQQSDIVLTDLDALKKTSSLWLQGRDFARFLIPPEKYSLKKETIELLIERYLQGRNSGKPVVEKAIRGYMAQKSKMLLR